MNDNAWEAAMGEALSPLRKISFTLVRPESAGNVGSVARVVRNFGLGELRIVGRGFAEESSAARLAHRSLSVLQDARLFDDVESAIGGAAWVIGTSGRSRNGDRHPPTVRSMASWIIQQAARGPGTILFGPESDGLSQRDLRHCEYVIRVPQRRGAPALNLAQAAAIIGAELFQAALLPGREAQRAAADRAGIERLVLRMKRLSVHCGFSVRNRPEETEEELASVLLRRQFDAREMAILELWLSQIEWFTGVASAGPDPWGGE